MHLRPPQPAPDRDAAALFRAGFPAAAIPAEHAALAGNIAGASPYLRQLMLRDPVFAGRVFREDADDLLGLQLAGLNEADATLSLTEVMARLRQVKKRMALLIAVADLSGRWNMEQVTAALTDFADAALSAAISWLLSDYARAGKVRLADAAAPLANCGYVALAMGKQGARELNYSSDIDLIILYDALTPLLGGPHEAATFFVRFTRRLVQIMQDVTEDGYVFRTDLRLRPDPRATQVAISIDAAEVYYLNQGQNWERAAMIKARPCAGDLALGDEFLGRLRPYIWRKYLDFAAIADVQSMKRQIHAVKGHGEVKVRGHNLKLGRGGIREIEFFVQTQQLIAGGRNPKLRGRSTIAMLEALADAQWITHEAAAELASAYRFLRSVEHRVQMVNDEQTHTLPAEDAAFESMARFCGFESGESFETEARRVLECVQGHYSRLFESAGELGTAGGSLVFTGGEDDPETIETLSRMGYRSPSEVSATIRGWHFGRYAATRSAKARELLTELMPKLLTALAAMGDADLAFLAFDKFLSGLPAGVQLFSLLKANPKLLDLLATILGSAPRLAEQLSRRPKVLDAVLDPGFFTSLPSEAEMARLIAAAMPEGLETGEVADRARIVGKEQAFRIGVRVLSETAGAAETGLAFSQLAGLLLGRLHRAVTEDQVRRNGHVPGGRSAVIAMGKLGGNEMTAGSDLDLIIIYDAAEGAEMSGGAKPLSVNQYYARLSQRLIAAVSAPTAEGVLYEVDMRLRPSGSKGPVAASLASFESYHRSSAWTWEKLALTRARPVCGDAGLMNELAARIRAALCEPRDAATVKDDVTGMRKLMLREQGTGGLWDVKRARGGLVELEFIAQTLQLIHAHRHPEVLDTNTLAALEKLHGAGLLSESDHAALRRAGLLYHRLTQMLRLCLDGPYDPAKALPALNLLVATAAMTPGIAAAEAHLAEAQGEVAAIFGRLVGPVS
ncbi:MAG: bifunctional [glutamine synthetase] adenylyltransferase/[glutamine synthetase]-adenylyl-L-tyrosine phosphorylase [Aestuariivirga sp.]|uniref:bifunctional [glutamine synthetase] adenylyltransferase/[glutamine synthetase]-adenylyl-L-tyrosine phosphorylase n=1 Tax=Aestuariivirga sp. TaxID=2650926 RepID=UPI0025C0AA67|nr:bifunctional [glutamine synthetase] adenylyltransferase/[glutamine synthetase]-adenylyl-L-tyrosine phosphorylase [Aestuariivirga sp.]MCA3559791.1 bifunctional [glutamine synthetase] adenylyltransferase/[glutamine synthetase]-adenylyl-L-tyrosine phosphorylase [Aestuariivirga sp.]